MSKTSHPRWYRKSSIEEIQTHGGSVINFSMPGYVHDMPANFGEDQLKGFGMARG